MGNWIGNLIEQTGYAGIALLMFLENVFPPIPSELVMPLSGFAAAKSDLNILGVVAAGSAGSLAGALMWYGIGRRLGDERLKDWASRHGRWITLSPDDVEKVDRWFDRHGSWTVLVGRLVPTVRTLIAIPAGIFAMPLAKFIPLTFVGTLFWEGSLALIGWTLGDQHESVQRYLGPVTTGIVVLLLLTYVYRVVTFDGRRKEEIRSR